MSQAFEYSRRGSIYAAAKLHEKLNGKVPFPTTAAHPRDVSDCYEFFYSQTIENESEIEGVLDAFTSQIAAGILADFPEGVSFSQYPRPDLNDRFPDAYTYRAEVMGVSIGFAAKVMPEAKRAQLTLVVEVNKWLPKSS